MGLIGFIKNLCYFICMVIIIIGIATLLTAQSAYGALGGVLMIIFGLIAILVFRRSFRGASKQKGFR